MEAERWRPCWRLNSGGPVGRLSPDGLSWVASSWLPHLVCEWVFLLMCESPWPWAVSSSSCCCAGDRRGPGAVLPVSKGREPGLPMVGGARGFGRGGAGCRMSTEGEAWEGVRRPGDAVC